MINIIAIICYYLQMLFHYIASPLNRGELNLKTSASLCCIPSAHR